MRLFSQNIFLDYIIKTFEPFESFECLPSTSQTTFPYALLPAFLPVAPVTPTTTVGALKVMSVSAITNAMALFTSDVMPDGMDKAQIASALVGDSGFSNPVVIL